MKALLLAIVIDALLGDPVYALHPVRLMGALIAQWERYLYRASHANRQQFIYGLVLVINAVTAVVVVSALIIWLSRRVLGDYAWLAVGVLLSQLLATRSLYGEGARILTVMKSGDLGAARQQIGYLVSRDTAELNQHDIYKAAVETLTENITDAIVAPLCFYLLFGFTGIAVYKVINTMDSMIGYKNHKYLYFGKAAARLDDGANFIPARIAAVLIMVMAAVLRDDVRSSVSCFLKQRHLHSSPNAGCTEAAMAGALSIQLSGPTRYHGRLVERPFVGTVHAAIDGRHVSRVMAYIVGVATLCYIVSMMLVRFR